MAKAELQTETIVQKSIVLTLSVEEAQELHGLLYYGVSRTYEDMPHVHDIYVALQKTTSARYLSFKSFARVNTS